MSHTYVLDRQTSAPRPSYSSHTEDYHGGAEVPDVPLVVALEREPGTPDAEVARAVGAQLGWPVYDQELRERIAASLGLSPALLEDIDERRPSWLMECLQGFAQGGGVSETLYVRRLFEVIRSLGRLGRCVIVGRGAGQILPRDTTLHVCLVGTRGDRLERLTGRLHVGRSEAARRLDDMARGQAEFLREYFHTDAANPGSYDLVLNTSQWSVAGCTDLIVGALRRKAHGHTAA
jgi:hypothetical protein